MGRSFTFPWFGAAGPSFRDLGVFTGMAGSFRSWLDGEVLKLREEAVEGGRRVGFSI